MEIPATRYATEGDLHIAYQVWGDGPIDLILVWGLFSHCELFWDDPPMARFLQSLGRFARVIHFDKRGTGMSDPIPGVPSLEERMDDVRIVMKAAGSTRAALFGESEGGPMVSLFAATFPEKVSHLVLFGPLIRLINDGEITCSIPPEQFDATLDAMVGVWGTGAMMSIAAPSRPEAVAVSARFERIALSRGAFRSLMQANALIDIRSVLPTVAVPTLVIHREGDQLVSVDQGKYAADHIPGARFVQLPGSDHYVGAGDTEALSREIEQFLTGAEAVDRSDVDRVLSTVLFTDIVSSTETATRLGDRKWRELLDEHDRLVGAEVARSRGQLVKSTGDGALATFDGPARAVRCARSIVNAVHQLGIAIRAGVHTGEVELRGEDIGGIGVHIGARVAAAAAADEVLVSRTVVDLVAGSGLEFADAGVHSLRGVPGDWPLFAAIG